MELRTGMRIEVLSKPSADWWQGRSLSSKAEGVFPASYVKPAAPPLKNRAPPPAPVTRSVSPYRNDYVSPLPSYHHPPPPQQPSVIVVEKSVPNPMVGRGVGGTLGKAVLMGAGAQIGANMVGRRRRR